MKYPGQLWSQHSVASTQNSEESALTRVCFVNGFECENEI